MTIVPPAKLATDGCLPEADPHPCDGERRFHGVDQRVLRGRDHLSADGKEHEPQAELCCPEREHLEQIDDADIERRGEWPDYKRAWCAQRHAAGNISVS